MVTGTQSDALRQREALVAAAHAGDARSQFQLAEHHRLGDQFTERDYAEALRWYRAAAEQGDPGAQNDLATMYLSGTSVRKNAEMAATWYRRAAEQGLDVAQFNLANCYLHGTGVEQDDKEAVALLIKAMAQDYGLAVTQLGTLYQLGRGLKQNFATAAELHVLAAKAGDSVALRNLSSYRQELERLALGGDPSASISLAAIFDRGLGVAQDQVTALAWVRWGLACYTQDTDEHVREALERMEFEHVIMGTPDVEMRAEALLAEMKRTRKGIRPR